MNPSHQHSTLPLAVAALALFSVLPHCRGQVTTQIIFEGPPPQPPGTFSTILEYSESGVWLRNPSGPPGLALVGSGLYGAPDNGTAYLYDGAPGGLAVSLLSGTPFDLLSLDVAEDSIYRAYPRPFEVIGYRIGGGTVTNVFTIDGIIDGPGGLPDFQTFGLDAGFVNLSMVAIPNRDGWGWSFDNFVLSVPEPATGVLVMFGSAFLALWLLKQKRHS